MKRADLDRILCVGRQMSNWCFNVGQQPGRLISKDDAESLRQMQREWDEAVKAVKVVPQRRRSNAA